MLLTCLIWCWSMIVPYHYCGELRMLLDLISSKRSESIVFEAHRNCTCRLWSNFGIVNKYTMHWETLVERGKGSCQLFKSFKGNVYASTLPLLCISEPLHSAHKLRVTQIEFYKYCFLQKEHQYTSSVNIQESSTLSLLRVAINPVKSKSLQSISDRHIPINLVHSGISMGAGGTCIWRFNKSERAQKT